VLETEEIDGEETTVSEADLIYFNG